MNPFLTLMGARRSLLLATAAAVLAVALAAPSADARTNNRSKPIVVVHGFNATLFGIDCTASYRAFGRFLANHPTRPYRSGFDAVAYYASDRNCSNNISSSRRPGTPARGNEHFGAGEHTTSTGTGHNNDTDIRHLGYHLAWYIHDRYTRRGRTVDVVAHSMGGVLVRYALQQVDRRHARFPPRLLVEDVVAMGSPHLGGSLSGLCPGTQQCSQLSAGSAFTAGLRANAQGRHPNPTNQAANPTDWTVMGSQDDLVVSETSALGMPLADHRVFYRDAANYDHDDFYEDRGSNASGGPDNIDVVVDNTPNNFNNFRVPTARRRGANWITFALQFPTS